MWYDTRSLQPLLPMYVSTVDSGNLAAHLLTLRVGLLALPDEPIVPRQVFAGIGDTLGVLTQSQAGDATKQQMELRRELHLAIAAGVTTPGDARRRLDRLVVLAGELAATGGSAAVATPADAIPQQDWTRVLLEQCQAARDELAARARWTSLASPPAGLEVLLPHARVPTLRELAGLEERVLPIIERELAADRDASTHAWLRDFRAAVAASSAFARQDIATIEELARQADAFATPDFDFLYDTSRRLLTIGYNVTERRRDPSYYDLLASEARLCSFLAIAQGQLPQENWFALGRLLTVAGGDPVLVSWSGSMFEYLMPLLVMPEFPDTLLEQTNRAAVRRQIEYGNQRGVPWGMSESGYNMIDAHRNYQYRAFGVPGLGLQRGLADDLVVAPYASALALMIEPEAACENLQRLATDGLLGQFGMYEAVDYTQSRIPRGQAMAVVRSYMAHHQGMSLLSIADLLLDHPLQRRFASDPQCPATLMLLHERIPRAAPFLAHPAVSPLTHATAETAVPQIRVIKRPDTPVPEVQLLSNGRYHVLVTAAGGGYSRWNDIAVTRWQEDPTRDHWGSFCYIRDTATGTFWSNTAQPVPRRPDRYEAVFTEGRAEFHRQDRVDNSLIETRTEIVVSPEDDIELRRIRLINRSGERRTVDITSYAEVVLAAPVADALHPAFSKLFVQTEILRSKRAVLCTRRSRAHGEQSGWLFHLMAVTGVATGEMSFETDRARFVGRGRTLADPRALAVRGQLSGTEGSVLDPVAAIRQVVVLEPDATATIDLFTGAAAARETAEHLIDRYQDRHLADRVFDLAWTHNQVVLQQFGISEAQAQEYERLAGSVIFANAAMRADASVILRNRRGQSGLWGYAISGDLPIVLLQIADLANIALVRQLLQARAYWRLKGLVVDLVIWTEDQSGYRQQLHDAIMGLIAAGVEANVLDRPGGIFVRHSDHISLEDRLLLQSVARIIILDSRGSLSEQLKRRRAPEARIPDLQAVTTRPPVVRAATVAPRADLILTNDIGGFTRDGREYVVTLTPGRTTPAPWVNVLANAQFGTVVSENGGGYTWSENAHEFRVTPWHNDPVTDESGEAFYLRDEETGRFWSPTPLPAPGGGSYVSRVAVVGDDAGARDAGNVVRQDRRLAVLGRQREAARRVADLRLAHEGRAVRRTDEVGDLGQRGDVHEIGPGLAHQPAAPLHERMTNHGRIGVADVLAAEGGAEEVDLETGDELVAAFQDRVRAEVDARLLDVGIEVGALVETADRCLAGNVEIASRGAVAQFAVRRAGEVGVGLHEAGEYEARAGCGIRRDGRSLHGLRSGRSRRGGRRSRRSFLFSGQLLDQLLEFGDARLEFLLLGSLRPRGGRHADHGGGECDRNDLAKSGVSGVMNAHRPGPPWWNYHNAALGRRMPVFAIGRMLEGCHTARAGYRLRAHGAPDHRSR